MNVGSLKLSVQKKVETYNPSFFVIYKLVHFGWLEN